MVALGVINDTESDATFETIIANNAAMCEANEGRPFSGRRVMETIKNAGKVIKHLIEGHNERRIVLNTVEGYTVNQQIVRDATGERVQIFATDMWRLRQISESLYTDPAEQRKAFISMVVYTLGVAATLTKGDLPVYVVSGASVPAPV
jgi:hypothetical protein